MNGNVIYENIHDFYAISIQSVSVHADQRTFSKMNDLLCMEIVHFVIYPLVYANGNVLYGNCSFSHISRCHSRRLRETGWFNVIYSSNEFCMEIVHFTI